MGSNPIVSLFDPVLAPIKVVFTIAGLNPETGGPARSVPALCSALAALEVGIELISLDYGTSVGKALVPIAPGLHTTLVDCSSPLERRLQWTPAFRTTLRRRCVETGCQILHDTGVWLPSNRTAAALSGQFRLPRIVSPRGMLTTWALQHRGWKKRLAWSLYQQRDLHRAQVLHATSNDEADGFRALGLRQPIAIIPNGVSLPPPLSPVSGFQDFSFSASQKRTVLFLSRLHPKKGLFDLVEAWAAVRPSGWRVVIAGPDDEGHRAQLESAVRSRGLSDDFSFVGSVEGEAKWNLYRQANLFVLPSYSENFGLVIAEALACGVPVLTTRATPWRELIDHRCGWWVEVGANPLAAALRTATALTDTERQEMGVRGRLLIEANYSWPHVAAQMKSVYAWMLGQGPRPNCVTT